MDRFSSNDKVYCADQMGGWTQDYDGSMGFDFLDSVTSQISNTINATIDKTGDKLLEQAEAKTQSYIEEQAAKLMDKYLGTGKQTQIPYQVTQQDGMTVIKATGEPIIHTVQKEVEDGSEMLKYATYALYGVAGILGVVLIFRFLPARTPARATA